MVRRECRMFNPGDADNDCTREFKKHYFRIFRMWHNFGHSFKLL